MATRSSILGGAPAPGRARGRDSDALGPSDSSDSGSDVQGERAMPTLPDNPGELGAIPIDTASDSDASGTGERASATGERTRDGADILPDRTGASGEPASASDLESLANEEDEGASGDNDDVEDAGDAQGPASTPASPSAKSRTRRLRR